MRMRSLGPWAPLALGLIALVLLVLGLLTDDGELVILGAAGALVLLVGYPVAEWVMGKDDDRDD